MGRKRTNPENLLAQLYATLTEVETKEKKIQTNAANSPERTSNKSKLTGADATAAAIAMLKGTKIQKSMDSVTSFKRRQSSLQRRRPSQTGVPSTTVPHRDRKMQAMVRQPAGLGYSKAVTPSSSSSLSSSSNITKNSGSRASFYGSFQKSGALLSTADSRPITGIAQDHTIFVGGLPEDIDTATLSEAFGKFGEMNDVRVITTKNPAFGFVSFTSQIAADRAITEMHRNFIEDSQITVSLSKKQDAAATTTSVTTTATTPTSPTTPTTTTTTTATTATGASDENKTSGSLGISQALPPGGRQAIVYDDDFE